MVRKLPQSKTDPWAGRSPFVLSIHAAGCDNLWHIVNTRELSCTVDIDWQHIDTVLLDMDGTLLDLAFDNYFWLHLVPETLSEQRGIPLEDAHTLIRQKYHAVQHTLNWYCLDYWGNELGLDIRGMTREMGPRAALRADTAPFLSALKQAGKRRVLLTNAHPYNLSVKLEHTGLGNWLDLLLSTHTFGYPKEDRRLWLAVQEQTGFDPARTLFIDDSEPILDAAKQFGIRYCLGVTNPDSGQPDKIWHRHPATGDYRGLLQALS